MFRKIVKEGYFTFGYIREVKLNVWCQVNYSFFKKNSNKLILKKSIIL